MKLTGRTILLTGGTSGIGLALASRLADAKNQVIVTGRRESLLDEVRQKVPSIVTERSDMGDTDDRIRLAETLTKRFPELDVVINNAGIQRKVSFVKGEPWADTREEIAINLEGPIHLATLFLPHLLARPSATLVNVSSASPSCPCPPCPCIARPRRHCTRSPCRCVIS